MKKGMILALTVALSVAASAQVTETKKKVETVKVNLAEQQVSENPQLAELLKQRTELNEQRNQLTTKREMIGRKGDFTQAETDKMKDYKKQEDALLVKIQALDVKINAIKKAHPSVENGKSGLSHP